MRFYFGVESVRVYCNHIGTDEMLYVHVICSFFSSFFVAYSRYLAFHLDNAMFNTILIFNNVLSKSTVDAIANIAVGYLMLSSK